MTDLCFIIDNNIDWIKYSLRRRGFIVYASGEDYLDTADDVELLERARNLGCFIVSHDIFFKDRDYVVYVPYKWDKRYNSWELVTKIIKYASLKKRFLTNNHMKSRGR